MSTSFRPSFLHIHHHHDKPTMRSKFGTCQRERSSDSLFQMRHDARIRSRGHKVVKPQVLAPDFLYYYFSFHFLSFSVISLCYRPLFRASIIQ
ncbi:hypothetical protein B9Z19DRAFT_1071730 [Tuber borchii]|uniref:Uncharacterized protein n=1 Tax=Tuber borchii TaxID=42251 RepID=A0A2T7A7W5_TUBBO|nr:hypothetical protein B9Z19DRAFT_1071730 [Tuber borchii]